MPSHRVPAAQRELAERASRGVLAGRPSAFHRGTLTGADLERIAALRNDITLLMSPKDRTASFAAVRGALPRAKVIEIDAPDHTIQNTPGVNRAIVGAMLEKLGLARR
jgi:hypothetical protein